jgi:hypothetical protein
MKWGKMRAISPFLDCTFAWGKLLIRGTALQKLMMGLFCVVAMGVAGCAGKDASIARVEGAEPQRLAFGHPEVVKASFAKKMQACWFSGTYPLLGGYHVDERPGTINISNVPTKVEQITLYSGSGQETQVFVVQFSPFNDNTLIATRNVSFPSELAGRLKHDVETWIFGGNDCGAGHRAPTSPYTPQEGSASQTMAQTSPNIPEKNSGTRVDSSRTALSKGAQ